VDGGILCRVLTKEWNMRGATKHLWILMTVALCGPWLVSPAQAQKVPDKTVQEVLIKTTLLSFNDANVTGNYTVLHAKASKPFRDQFPPEKMKQVFNDFAAKHIDIAYVAAMAPVPDADASINDNGILALNGHFETKPKILRYSLGFIMSDGEWKPIKISVDIK
jgi:hypothetical protein